MSIQLLATARVLTGTGTPEGVVAGSVGDSFFRTDGGTGTTLYIKESGSATNTGWRAMPGTATVYPEFQFYGDQLQNPVSSDWAVNALAPAAADSSKSALTVRRFDDASEEGVGFMIETPSAASSLTIQFRGRAETAPGVAKGVILKLYWREMPDNAAVSAWSGGTTLTTIDIPTNANYQYDTQTLTFAGLGLTAGRVTQFELTRNGASGSDSLVGDWDLLEVKVTFS